MRRQPNEVEVEALSRRLSRLPKSRAQSRTLGPHVSLQYHRPNDFSSTTAGPVRFALYDGKIAPGPSASAFSPRYTREIPRTTRRIGSTPFSLAKKISPTRLPR